MNLRNTFFTLLFSVFCLAQNGYNLNFNFKKVSADSLELSVYNGTESKFYTLQTISTQNKQGKFTESNKIIDGIYRLNFKGADKKDFVNIVVDNGTVAEFTLEGNNIKDLKTENDLNTLFINSQKARSYPERNSIYSTIQKKYPNSVAYLYTELDLKKFESNKLPKQKDSAKAFRDSYFKNIDLDDKRIPLLPNIYSALYDYVSVTGINPTDYNESIDVLLKDQNCQSRNMLFYLKWIFMNLEYLQRYKMYDSYLYVFNNYMNKGECIAKNEQLYSSVVKRLQNYEKLPIGAEIPNFEMVDADSKPYFINEIYPEHKYTFLAFYDPDCSHCKKQIPEINEYFNNLKAENKDLDVHQIAFLNATSDYAWEYFIEKNKMDNWQHVKSEDKSLKYINQLDVFANPAFFLIDQNGKILLKNYNEDEMNKIFKSK